MSKNNTVLLAVIIILIIVGVIVYAASDSAAPASPDAYPGQNMQDDSADDVAIVTTNSTTTSTTTLPSVVNLKVSGKNYSFTPSTLTVKKGDTVRIMFENAGGTHDFKIDEFSVKTAQLADGQSQTVEFTASKAGTFEYYCSVGNHRAMGMKGTLTVTE